MLGYFLVIAGVFLMWRGNNQMESVESKPPLKLSNRGHFSKPPLRLK